jgi:hypothetical protein
MVSLCGDLSGWPKHDSGTHSRNDPPGRCRNDSAAFTESFFPTETAKAATFFGQTENRFGNGDYYLIEGDIHKNDENGFRGLTNVRA